MATYDSQRVRRNELAQALSDRWADNPGDPCNDILAEIDELNAQLTPSGKVKITPHYPSISVAHDIAEPWINLWSGDEWGEVMGSLLGAIQTDYGISDENLVVLCEVLWRTLEEMWQWASTEGVSYDFNQPDDLKRVREECRGHRDYWLQGSNLGDFRDTIKQAKETIDSLPDWVFGEDSA